MNKKKLSVVMAGAMLATSVAPVLADTTNSYETTKGNMGLLIDRLDTLLASKKFADTDIQASTNKSSEAGKSVYRIQIKDAKGEEVLKGIKDTDYKEYTINKKPVNLYYNTNVLKTLASSFDSSYYTVTVYELGNRTDSNGRIVSTEIADGTNVEYKTWTQDDINAIGEGTASGLAKAKDYILDTELNEDKSATITLSSKTDGKFNTLNLKAGDAKVYWEKPVDAAGVSIAHMGKEYIQANIAGFEKVPADSNVTAGTVVDITGSKAKVAYTVKVNNGDVNYTVNVNDLYDGFMLTDKGHDLLNAIKIADQSNGKIKVNYSCADSHGTPVSGTFDKVNAPINKLNLVSNGSERLYTLTFINTNTNTTSVVKIEGKSTEEDRMVTLLGWLKNRKATVDILAGSNRYATAVEIAKTYLLGRYDSTTKKDVDEFVLVNGDALVDGLAAAPYSKVKSAPILLTETNRLPKETKNYLREFVSTTPVGDLDEKTITIIGGESVVSQSVVDELKEIGFTVKRISGDNREETSLAVAAKVEAASKTKYDKAYVVGANGEADAMSIASNASLEGSPIIVSKSTKGLSTVAINELGDYSHVEIIGGNSSVNSSDEEKLKDLVDNKNVTRINGKNRFETNALVIDKYHSGYQDVLVTKDGQRSNNTELVDALPAALFASLPNRAGQLSVAAPIVLATDKLSDSQINQLVLNSGAKKETSTVYQIGGGVNVSVLQTIVTKLGLNK